MNTKLNDDLIYQAEQGNIKVLIDLGDMYLDGEGVPRDFKAAFLLLSLAADQGSSYAQAKIGQMYAQGKYVPKDFVRAYKWFNVAARSDDYPINSVVVHDLRGSGVVDVSKEMDLIVHYNTKAYILQAQQLATAWMEKHEISAAREMTVTDIVRDAGHRAGGWSSLI